MSFAHTVGDVLAHVEVRKQQDVLRHIAGAALTNRHVDVALGIEQQVAVDGDSPAAWSPKTRYRLERRRLAGSRRTEQRERSRFDVHRERQRELSLVEREVQIKDRHYASLARRLDASTATKAIEIEITRRMAACRSCPVSVKL